MRFWVFSAAAVLAVPALAGTKPLYAPAPAWVLPAPPIAAAVPGDDASATLILDQQQRLQDGEVWSYVDTASRMTSEQMLQKAGTISINWQPDSGDLIIHRLSILRDGQSIDLLAAPDLFTVLRRERGLEQLQIDGVLTATTPVQGLRVGDVLRLSYSITHSDPVLKGQMQTSAMLIAEPARAGFARARLLWKAGDVRWKALTEVKDPKIGTSNGYHELLITLPLPKRKDVPRDAPARFQNLPAVEASSFKDWAAVSKVMAPLYATAGTIPPGAPLAAEVARIKAASDDPKIRTALALRTVQSEVRYLFNGLDHGNYVPQTPEKTWSVRYGDCKAKTLLLLALLSELGISAEPVLAHTQLGDFVAGRLPSAAAFNHVLVKAEVKGETLWLDGTTTGTRLADLADTPNFHSVLPIRSQGAGLFTIVTHPNVRANFEITQDIDQSAGIGIAAPFSAALTLRGPVAEGLKAAAAQVSADKKKEMIDGMIGRFVGYSAIISRDIDYDPESATATVRVTGINGGTWSREDQRFEWTLDKAVAQMNFDGDRARPEWKDIPVATGGVLAGLFRTRVRLPDGGKGFALEGDTSFAKPLAGEMIQRHADLKDGVVAFEDRIDETATEITPADIAATRNAVAQAKSRLLKILAPADYPPRWQVVQAATAAGKLKAIEDAYARTIVDATEKAPAYRRRAEFRASVFDRKGAIADLDAVIASRPDVEAYLTRGRLLWQTRNDAKALADAKAAFALDPGDEDAVSALTIRRAEQGESVAALALLDERIAAGGKLKPGFLATKAEILARLGQATAAIAASDAAVAAKPGDASLLNARCWTKATLGVSFDTALKDCTKAIELGEAPVQALDSRGLVYFKLGRLDDALADVNAALDLRPELPASLYMRGIIKRRQGNTAAGDADLTGARLESPRIDEEYARYGVTP